MSDERFRRAENLMMPGGSSLEALVEIGSRRLIDVRCDGKTVYLTAPEARALRDWLDQVLPPKEG